MGALLTALPLSDALASDAISGGVWFNYRYLNEGGEDATDRDEETLGDIADEALIIYVDDAPEDQRWSISGEVRFGPGSFTQPGRNSTGDTFTVHKAWIGLQLDDVHQLQIGKSQVPFGWKTVNFWPGDILQAGYGDQMDVGFKLKTEQDGLNYQLAYYHADDWGETSTDTVDDNGHWGSATTYRKVQTLVGDVSYQLTGQHTVGISAQAGNLQDLTGIDPSNPVNGDHNAGVVYYHGTFNNFYVKGEVISAQRNLPEDFAEDVGLTDTIKTTRGAVELGLTQGQWFFYLDASWASTDTEGNDADMVGAYAPGVSYDYGPGWLYFEYLSQDGFVNANGDVGEGDFDAFYASIDYYF